AAILFPVFAQAREKARAISCLSNTKQMALATIMYAQDYDEIYCKVLENYFCPLWGGGDNCPWEGMLQPYVKNYNIFSCPYSPILAYSTDPADSPGNVTQGTFPDLIVGQYAMNELFGFRSARQNHTPDVSLATLDKPADIIFAVDISA